MHPFIPVLSPSFLYHPYIPSFKSKDFSFTCLLSSFFCCTLHITLRICLGLFIVVYTLVVFISCCRKCVMYVRQLSLLQLLICDRVRENQPCRQKYFCVFRRISEKYRLMDLRCKFGVDCLLPARDIATFICVILKIYIPKRRLLVGIT